MKNDFIFGRNLESSDDHGFSVGVWSDCAGCYESAQNFARMLWYVDVCASVTDLDDLRVLNLERLSSGSGVTRMREICEQIAERVSLV